MRSEVDDARARGDVREGGSWTPLQRGKNDLIFVAVAVALAVTRRLPEAWLRAAGRIVGAAAHALAPGLRRRAEENVARAFPDLDARACASLVRRNYTCLGENLGDAVASLRPSHAAAPLPFATGARGVLESALGEGRGVVFASAHLGPWERVAETLVHAGFPFAAVAREAYDPRLDAIYTRLRAGRGVRTIYRGRPGAPAALLRVLRAGGLLGVPMDLASRVPSVEVPFLGVDAPTPVGPAKLAIRTGAAVVVGTAALEHGRLVVDVTRIGAADLAGRGASREARDIAARALTARINEALSARIRAMPEAWPWMHARFPPRSAARAETAAP